MMPVQVCGPAIITMATEMIPTTEIGGTNRVMSTEGTTDMIQVKTCGQAMKIMIAEVIFPTTMKLDGIHSMMNIEGSTCIFNRMLIMTDMVMVMVTMTTSMTVIMPP